MPEDKKWSRNEKIGFSTLFVTVLGLIVASLGYIQIPNSTNNKEIDLDCILDKPIIILDENSKVEGNFKINSINIEELYMRSASIHNSGKKAIKNLIVTYKFLDIDKDLNIHIVISNSSPEDVEFIKLNETNYSIKYSYPLLNPDDKFTRSFLIDRMKPIEVTLRTEGYSHIFRSDV